MPSPTNDVPSPSEKERLATRLASLSPAQRDLLQKKLAQRAATSSADEQPDAAKIAVVGMGCRFPGANSPDAYWDLISGGIEAVGAIPEDRWERDLFFDPTGRSPGKMSVDAIGAIENVDGFDPAFFGIAPREASRMDPQQRLLLEVAWETFEDAGIPIDSMAGSNTGVFIGIGGTDYSKVPARYPNYFDHVDAHIGTGNALSIAAGRLSYIFDFHGPSFIVDTACSSALVAIHSAVVSLQRGESHAAVAGGVNLILSPETTIAFSKARMLSPDGHCRPFDNGANGYVRGEGCGLVLLKRLPDAQRDGDQILGVIRGTAVNQDGRTSGITAPNGEAQQKCIRSALEAARLNVDDVSYIEAHGTGTPLGDPIELMALEQTFQSRSDSQPPIRVGSVKANIGHTETASGIAGLIKVLLMLKNAEIPAQANFKSINSAVRLNSKRIRVADQSEPWNGNSNGQLVAGVSSFGFGGTNTHLIVEKGTSEQPTSSNHNSPPTLVLPLSASDDDALKALANRYHELLQGLNSDQAFEVCCAAATQRANLPVRAAATGTDPVELAASLDHFTSLIQGRKPAGRRPRIALLFTGQGSQYSGMAVQLCRALPSFDRALDKCAEILDPVLGVALRDLLDGSATKSIDHTSLAQPAICAVQCALVDSLRALNIQPDVVTGHSVGEIAGLYSAGALDRKQALLIAAARGRTMGNLPEGGSMAAILESAEQVQSWIDESRSSAVIATMNGKTNTVVAGAASDVDQVIEIAERNDAIVRRLAVSHAFHSPLMEAAVTPLREQLETFFEATNVPSHVTFISSVTGKPHSQPIDVDYWADHLLRPVRFTDVMQVLNDSKLDLAIEIGPSPHLCSMLRRSGSDDAPPVPAVPTLDPKRDDYSVWVQAAAQVWCSGVPVQWKNMNGFSVSNRAKLPTYPFQRSRFWYDPPSIGNHGGGGVFGHPLLGVEQSLAVGGTIYTAVVRENDPSYLADHVVSGSTTVPAAAWIETLRAGAAQHFGDNFELTDVQIDRALFLESETPVSIQTSVQVASTTRCKLQIAARTTDSDAEWQICAHAVATKGGQPSHPLIAVNDSSKAVKADQLYQAMASSQLEYGDFFQVLEDIKSDGQTASATLRIDSQLAMESSHYVLHPTLLDGALQLIATVVPEQDSGQTFLPVGLDRLRIVSDGQIHSARVQRIESPSSDQIVANVQLLTKDDEIVADLASVRLQNLKRKSSVCGDPSLWIHQIEWAPTETAEIDDTSLNSPIVHVGGDQLKDSLRSAFDVEVSHRERWVWTTPELPDDLSDAVQIATENLLDTLQSAIAAENTPQVLVITSGAVAIAESDSVCPVAAAIVGLSRVAQVEHPQLNLRMLDAASFEGSTLNAIEEWVNHDSDESEMAFRNRKFYQPRLVATPRLFSRRGESEVSLPHQGSYRIRLDGSNRTEGLWVERISPPEAHTSEVSLRISAVGLNFSDVLKSMGLYPGVQDDVVPMGIEVCGTITKLGKDVTDLKVGQRVMGIVPYGFASDDATKDYLLVPVPENLDDEEAASTPVVFMTAHHALCNVGRLREGESVLIHAGAGGVGIAAIQIALATGAEVFTTAGSELKRNLLATLGVNPRHIFDSRDVRSIECIRDLTNGKGVDVVLNSLPGEWIDVSLGLLAAQGRFLEIGKTDIYQDRPLGLAPFQDNLTYSAIDLDRIFRSKDQEVRDLFAAVAEKLAAGIYQPLPITSYRLDELPAAMRFMAARRNIGKIVVRPPKSKPDAVAQAQGVHLITGGSGTIARGIARRLIQRGVRTVALVARRKPTDKVLHLQDWAKSRGATCLYLQADCADEQSLRDAVAQLPKESSIVSVIHAAGLLDDQLLHELTPDSLQRVLRPKVAGVVNLDRVTSNHPVESFALLGSIASVFGSPGQANYAAANAFLEGFAHHRRQRGLPGSVVHWGPWGESAEDGGGMASDPTRLRNLASRGLRPLEFQHGLDLLIDAAFSDIASSVAVDANFGKMLAATTSPPSVLRSMKMLNAEVSSTSMIDDALLSELRELEVDDQCDRLTQYFANKLGKIISMDPASIDPTQSLGSLGLDSLMAIELKNSIEASLDVSIPIKEFLDDPTLQSLGGVTVDLITKRESVPTKT